MTVYYVDVTTGDNGDSGLTEGLAWADLGYAANQVSDGDKVWVKASASYTADDPDTATTNWEIDDAGTATSPIVWEGYTSSTGDGGVVTVDAQDTNTNALLTSVGGSVYNVIINFRFTQATSYGVSQNGSTDAHVTYKNCRFDNNGSHGIVAGTYTSLEGCLADNNSGSGFYLGSYSHCLGCISHTNTANGFYAGLGSYVYCIAYGCGSANAGFSLGSGNGITVVGCVADCDGGATSTGFDLTQASATPYTVCNCIAFDCNEGIASTSDCGEQVLSRNNLFYSNTTDRTNWITGSGSVAGTSDPFTDSGSRDYSLKSGSEAIDAGYDASQTVSDWGL